jgi:Concanavalin A-like lectin/glucanases superfamily
MKMKQHSMLVLGLLAALCLLPISSQADLLGFWGFNEGSGASVTDSSINDNNGSVFNLDQGLGDGGAAWVIDAERGSVISFNGLDVGAYALAGEAIIPVMTLENDFTWSFWAKQAEGNSENQIILGNRMSIEQVDFEPRQFIKFTPTKFEWHTEGNGDDNLDYEDIPNDVWLHHVVVKTADLLTYYRDGVEAGSQVITQALYDAQPLFAGGDNQGAAGENWAGYIDNIRIYDNALTADLVAALFNAESVGAPAELIGFWEFEEGDGELAADSSGNGNDGTVNNVGNGLGEGGSAWVNDSERESVISSDGTAESSYVLAGDTIAPVMTLENDFTWSFWAKQAEGNTENQIVFGNRMSIELVDFEPRQFIKFTPTKFEWHTEGNGDDNLDYEDIPNGVWLHHVVVKSANLLTYYRNGEEAASRTIAQTLYDAQPLFFGGDNQAAEGENWAGYIDNARIYNGALTAAEVAAQFNAETRASSAATNWELMK